MCKNMWPRWWRSKKEKRQPAMNDSCAGEIVVQLRQWEGEYWSKDIPGGTTQAPHTDSFFLVNAAETSVRQLRIPIADPVYPLFSSDGQWLYFQSNASGHFSVLVWVACMMICLPLTRDLGAQMNDHLIGYTELHTDLPGGRAA